MGADNVSKYNGFSIGSRIDGGGMAVFSVEAGNGDTFSFWSSSGSTLDAGSTLTRLS